ncbi:MAG: cell elongation protein CozEb [Herpetosiphon sp.]
MPQNVTIQITVKGIVMLLVTALLVLMLVKFNQILLILFLAILLAVAIDPLTNKLERRGVPRALAIVLQYVVILGTLGLVLSLLGPVLTNEFTSLGTNLPTYLTQLAALPTTLLGSRAPQLTNLISAGNITQQIGGELGKFASGLGGALIGLGKVLSKILINTFLILVVGFFLTSDARFAPHLISRFFPPRQRATASELASEIGGRLGHWVRAQLLVGLFFGTLFGLGLKIAGVPNAISLAVVGGVLELIPYVGGAIVTVIGMVVAVNVSPWLSLFVVGWYLVVANIESHVVYPKLVGNIVGLHPLTIIIALFVGAELKGIMGALLAVPVAVVLQVLFDHFYRFDDTVTTPSTVGEERAVPTPGATSLIPKT